MCVYFIQAKSSGLVKIGRTHDVSRRFQSLKTSCPEELKLLFSLSEQQGKFTEALLHERFKDYRVRGEWFKPEGELLDFINNHPSGNESFVESSGFRISTPDQLAAIIHSYRLRKRMTQLELSEKAGVSRVFINQIEKGKPEQSYGWF